MNSLSREDLYTIHQNNIQLLENEMALTKDMALVNIGKLESLKCQYASKTSTSSLTGQIKKAETDVLSATRLYTLLLCSWLECRLKVILYEPSSVAFSDLERSEIKKMDEMSKRWKMCFNLALLKGCGITYTGKSKKLSKNQKNLFVSHSSVFSIYDTVFDYLDMITGAIQVRNRLAHGEWYTQLNSNGTKLSSDAAASFIAKYDNIQKLDRVFSMFKEIAGLINSYVVYKDRESLRQNKFIIQRDKYIQKINHIKSEIENRSFDKFALQQMRNYDNQRERQKKIACFDSQ